MTRIGAILACLLFLNLAWAETPPDAPLSAGAATVGDMTYVWWTPPTQSVDGFNIYGVRPDGTLEFLLTTSELSADFKDVEFARFAITAMKLGIESVPTYTGIPCIRYSIEPPDVRTERCDIRVPILP